MRIKEQETRLTLQEHDDDDDDDDDEISCQFQENLSRPRIIDARARYRAAARRLRNTGIMHRRCCLLVSPAGSIAGALHHKL